LLFAGGLLLTPGFLTDTIGFILMVPQIRLLVAKRFISAGIAQVYTAQNNQTQSFTEQQNFGTQQHKPNGAAFEKHSNKGQNADIFVLLSNSEGMPLSVLEALSYSKPIVLSDIPSMQTFIADDNGMLVDNNVHCIVKVLKEMEDKNLKQMGESSKHMFDARFNLENQKDVYLNYYDSLI